jgi:hypothetical protein
MMTAYNAVGSGTLTKYSYIANGGWGLPIQETFASGFDYLHWTISNPDMSITWDTITVPGVSAGTKAAWMNFFNYSGINKRDQLISPAMDFSGYETVTLTFRHAYAQRASLKDSLIVRISADCGSNWTRVWGMGPDGTANTFVTHPSTLDEFYPASADDWCNGSYGVSCYSIDLSPWAGNNGIKVMFEGYNRNGNNLFINDVSIAGPVGMKDQTGKDLSVSVYPNPTTGSVTLTVHGQKGLCILSIFDIHGQQVYSDQFTTENGLTSRQIDLGGNARGVYYLKLTSDQVTQVSKIILQ